jgi:hypothetical protein
MVGIKRKVRLVYYKTMYSRRKLHIERKKVSLALKGKRDIDRKEDSVPYHGGGRIK